MTQENYWQFGTWRGIPVSMHWTVLLACIWLYLFFWSLLGAAIGSVAYVALLIGHEMGHVAVCRRRKIPVESITLYLLHGRTSHGFASTRDEILIAWAGVGAQAVILLLALAAGYALDPALNPVVLMVAGTILFVLTKVNLVLMVVALLPIGPFDGRGAWAVIPYLRGALRRRRQRAREIEMFPEKGLSAEKRRELEESSSKAAADLMEKFAKKSNDPKEEESR